MTVVEVLVSLGLLGAALAATNLAEGRTTAALRAATQRDMANELTRATLEEAKAYGCGLVIGTEPDATLSAWRQHCWGGLGDSSYARTTPSAAYSVTLRTAWTQLDATGGSCGTSTATPDGLVRDVTVVWGSHVVSADDYESVPPDSARYHNADDGALIVTGSPGETSTLTVGPTTITRAIGPNGCLLWPFVPAEPVSWTVGARSGTAVISPGQVKTT